MTVRRGLVIGKFLPLHRGHRLLLETASSRCDELTVALFARSDEPIPRDVRVAWLRELFPEVRVVGGIDDHVVDFADDDAWEHWTGAIVAAAGHRPDVVFSSEDYGAELARRLGAAHELVDLTRAEVPVSATEVRRDPLAAWPFLDAPVRAWFVRRVAVVGAESTGKTTLCERLAERFATAWVPEYGRAYCEVRGLEAPWTSDEFDRIAAQQLADEDAAARVANRVLFCDTDTLATSIWHEHYCGARSPTVEATIRPYDLHLLATPDVPWVDDGLRDSPHARDWMTERFAAELDARGATYEVLAGPFADREAIAVAAVERLLVAPWPGSTYQPDERHHTRHR